MIAYIALFFILSFLFFFLLIGLALIKFMGLLPLANKIISKLFSRHYDRKYEQNERQPINTDCYICLQKVSFQVVATCNHSFCGSCIIDYFNNQRLRSNQIKCPACRKQICILYRRQQPRNRQQKELKRKIAEFNCANSKQIGFFRSIFEFTNIIKHVGVLFSAEGIKFILQNPRMKYILMLLIYTLSPIDLMPQIILGPLGLADDTFASLQLLRQFSNLWIQFIRDQSNRQRMSQ